MNRHVRTINNACKIMYEEGIVTMKKASIILLYKLNPHEGIDLFVSASVWAYRPSPMLHEISLQKFSLSNSRFFFWVRSSKQVTSPSHVHEGMQEKFFMKKL